MSISLALIDLERRMELAVSMLDEQRSSARFRAATRLIVRRECGITIRMDASGNHRRAHVHIDVQGGERHVASIAVDTGELLAGTLPNRHRATLLTWIEEHREPLLTVFSQLSDGVAYDKRNIDAALKGSTNAPASQPS